MRMHLPMRRIFAEQTGAAAVARARVPMMMLQVRTDNPVLARMLMTRAAPILALYIPHAPMLEVLQLESFAPLEILFAVFSPEHGSS